MPENRGRTGRNAPRTAWKPGQSGNPGGRPKSIPELVEASRALTPMALEVWAKVMADYIEGRGDGAHALKAASDSMSRAWGRPAERVEVRADVTSAAASDEEQLIATIRRLAGEDDNAGRTS